MESVWWVFKQLHEKKLVYRGFKVSIEEILLTSLTNYVKVMPYSTACTTPLSNFETAQNYQIVIGFPPAYVLT